jgi:hypothetical protein
MGWGIIMKATNLNTDIDLLLEALKRIGLKPGISPRSDSALPVKCNYLCNKDGSIRWIWPSGSRQPDFLRFYNICSWRSFVFVLFVRLAFRLGLKRCLSQGGFTLYLDNDNTEIVLQDTNSRWSLFTGTPGPNRNVLFWYQSMHHGSIFIKVALQPKNEWKLDREARSMQRFEGVSEQVLIPLSKYTGNGVLIQQDISGGNVFSTNRFAKLPVPAVQDWLSTGLYVRILENAKWWQRSKHFMEKSAIIDSTGVSASLAEKLKKLMAEKNLQQDSICSRAYGDFTPWNIMIKGDKLCLVNWALSEKGMPVLYDVFHFVYQSNILIGNKGYGAIRKELDNLFARPEWKKFLGKYEIDVIDAEQNYLIYTISYYLDLYTQQAVWQKQVNWLFNTWNEALTFQMYNNNQMSVRKLVFFY